MRRRPLGFAILAFALMPTSVGYQDISSLIARQPSVSQRWRDHVMSLPLGTMQASILSLPRPIGASIPDPFGFQQANFDPRTLDVTGAITPAPESEPEMPLVYPTVNRALKGDLLVARAKPPAPPQTKPARPDPDRAVVENSSGAPSVDSKAVQATPPSGKAEIAALTDEDWKLAPPGQLPTAEPQAAPDDPDVWPQMSVDPGNPSLRTAHLYFGADAIGTPGAIEPWAPGEQPTLHVRREVADPDIKLSAKSEAGKAEDATDEGGETVAGKGEVTGEGKRPKTPAERLGLDGKARQKAEKCLADAVYFESRGEPERGQVAVAQVVMNRVFSPFYPDSVCGVVYQNAHRHLACQFTFACEGKRLVVDEPDMWEQAKRISRDTLDGKLWLPEVGKSTHYHAYWVRPSWIREMKRNYKFGVHTFYRPRAWGDGSDEPAWGSGAKVTVSLPALPPSDPTTTSVGESKL